MAAATSTDNGSDPVFQQHGSTEQVDGQANQENHVSGTTPTPPPFVDNAPFPFQLFPDSHQHQRSQTSPADTPAPSSQQPLETDFLLYSYDDSQDGISTPPGSPGPFFQPISMDTNATISNCDS